MKTYKIPYNLYISTRHCKMVIFTVFAICFNIILKSQDIQFSQYYSAKFSLAPSFAGTSDGGRGTTIFRDQWPALKSTYITYGFAFDYSIPELAGGVGVYALQDNSCEGAMVMTNMGMQYSYSLKIKHPWMKQIWYIHPGFQLNTINRKINTDKIIFNSQLTFGEKYNTNSVIIESDNISIFESAVSFLLNSETAWFGANVEHLPLSKKSFSLENYTSPVKLTSFGGLCLKTIQGRLLYDKYYLYFTYRFKYMKNIKQLDLGGYWTNQTLSVGLWYRGLPFFKNSMGEFNNTALVTIIGMEFKQYNIGYSFDYSLSKIGSITGGAHEISFVWLFNQGEDLIKKKYKMVPSPKF